MRDPFGTCRAPARLLIRLAACGLNIIPAGRLDPNAIELLNLYPIANERFAFSNFATSPKLFEHRNSFDARMDVNFNEKNQMFYPIQLG